MVRSPNVMDNNEFDFAKAETKIDNMMYATAAEVGTRIDCCGDYGTVKYVGEIAGYKGIWLGIDWDDASRGKHNGSVENVKYFTASYPTSGSFLRPQKVSLGTTAVTALQKRYGKVEDVLRDSIGYENIISLQKTINAPFLEMVGFDKVNLQQSNFNDLTILSLSGQSVNGSGDLNALALLCPNIKELDLSRNLFSDWTSVIKMCENMKNLHWLNVSENKLIIPENISDLQLPSLKTIICGKMNLSWADLVKLSSIWPNIEEIGAAYNEIVNIDTEHDIQLIFPKLQALDLDSNYLESWSTVLNLGLLDTLQKLNLNNTQLSEIVFDDCGPGEKTRYFKSLKMLLICQNLIQQWKSISELEKLQNLEELKVFRNPLMEVDNLSTCFQLIVARIENLKCLNGRCFTTDERRGAEYDYIKKQGKEWLASENDMELRKKFVDEHPRFPKLIEKYGAPEESELRVIDTSLKSNLIELEIVDVTNCKTIKKKLPPNMLVEKFITLIQRLFKLDYTPRLSYVTAMDSDCERDIDNNFKDLKFYSLQNGDKIFVKM